MDNLSHYRQIIHKAMRGYERLFNLQPTPGIDEVYIADDERGHYLLLAIGWAGHRRARHIRIYVRLKDDKIWIEDDMTERGIATDLIEAGVPKEDIVLGFQPPSRRPMTEFAGA
jgi:hypothetical protein